MLVLCLSRILFVRKHGHMCSKIPPIGHLFILFLMSDIHERLYCVHNTITQYKVEVNSGVFFLTFQTGSTALFFSSQQGHHEVVKLLFEFGASTEFQTKVCNRVQ